MQKRHYDKVIYVAGKFQNNPTNKKYIEACCKQFFEKYPNYLFINGVSQFGYMYEYTTQKTGIQMCLELMKMCDEVWTIGQYENSIGTYSEIMVAENLGIPVYEHKDREAIGGS